MVPISQSRSQIELGRAGLVVIDADRHNPKEDGVQAFAALGVEHQEFPHPQSRHGP